MRGLNRLGLSTFMPRDTTRPAAETELRARIERNDPTVTAAEYDAFVLSRGRDDVACAVRDVLAGVRDDMPFDTLLEAAMGTGILSRRLRELPGLRTLGIDKRLDWMHFAVECGRTTIQDVAAADFEALPFAPESFGAVTGLAFLNHRRDSGAFYRESHRVLKPGGPLLLPWVKPKADSLEREAALMVEHGFRVVRSEAWYLLARKA